ncbi:glycine dehydrogenase (aminomethyl-transferring), partial [Actinomycetota bacterium]
MRSTWFDTLTVKVPGRAEEVVAAAEDRLINLWLIDVDTVGVSVDETTTPAIIDAVLESFFVDARFADIADAPSGLPAALVRTSDYMTHPVFSLYRSETEMLRYMRKLQQKDIA